MKKVNCLIIDDEEPARDLIDNYIERLPHLVMVGKCANPLEAMQVLQAQKVDLIFLDIQMPELTGIEFLKTLTNKPLIIFTTAYKEYALQGYELDVVDYLLKPFRFERFVQAINKAGELLKHYQIEGVSKITARESSRGQNQREFILVKSEFKVYRILYNDILFIESMKEYVAYHTPEGRTLSLSSLKRLEHELPTDQFMRVHKSYIVNKNKVSVLEGNQIRIDKVKIPIGASYRERVLAELF